MCDNTLPISLSETLDAARDQLGQRSITTRLSPPAPRSCRPRKSEPARSCAPTPSHINSELPPALLPCRGSLPRR